MRHLFGIAQLDHQMVRYAEPVRHGPGDVHRIVADALDRRDHLQNRTHRMGLARMPNAEHRQRPHVGDQLGHLRLEVSDLFDHLRIPEVDGRVRQIDHQL
jgi:hypothetical protein